MQHRSRGAIDDERRQAKDTARHRRCRAGACTGASVDGAFRRHCGHRPPYRLPQFQPRPDSNGRRRPPRHPWLAAHTKALLASPRCSLLIGEPGKGDPLAWPRISLQCDAEQIGSDNPEREHLRARFLRRHPKASLYIDFPDFMFFRLVPASASLNGGFGKAYALTPDDLGPPSGFAALTHEEENRLVAEVESRGLQPAGFRLGIVASTCLIYESRDKKKVIPISQIIDKQ